MRHLILFLATLALIGCDGETQRSDAGADAGRQGDAGSLSDAGDLADADPPSDAGSGDAGCSIDCPELPEGCYYDGQDCEADRCGDPICPEPDTPCGGLFNPICPTTHYCDYTEPGACGLLDETGICRPRPTGCSTECVEVCSCDGTTYCNECEALAAGRDVASEGPCGGDDPCRPMDAFGIGECTRSAGWVWNGSECVEIFGCSCDGTDCFRVESNEELCEAPFAACTGA